MCTQVGTAHFIKRMHRTINCPPPHTHTVHTHTVHTHTVHTLPAAAPPMLWLRLPGCRLRLQARLPGCTPRSPAPLHPGALPSPRPASPGGCRLQRSAVQCSAGAQTRATQEASEGGRWWHKHMAHAVYIHTWHGMRHRHAPHPIMMPMQRQHMHTCMHARAHTYHRVPPPSPGQTRTLLGTP